ncbi:hypothetical protein NBRC116494_18070 [Aurantivibrio plasticivorans]
MSNKLPQSGTFLANAVKARLDAGKHETDRLRDLSDGLDWLKDVIDGERERIVNSKLLTFKLLYSGYFGTKGRSTKFARNPCAIREALKFCRTNGLPAPDWVMKYLYDLMAGKEQAPTTQDEKRWNNLMKLLDLANEWDKKSKQGMKDAEIERYFKRKGVGDTPLRYAKAFVNPETKNVVFEHAKSLNDEPLIDLDKYAGILNPRDLDDEDDDADDTKADSKSDSKKAAKEATALYQPASTKQPSEAHDAEEKTEEPRPELHSVAG